MPHVFFFNGFVQVVCRAGVRYLCSLPSRTCYRSKKTHPEDALRGAWGGIEPTETEQPAPKLRSTTQDNTPPVSYVGAAKHKTRTFFLRMENENHPTGQSYYK